MIQPVIGICVFIILGFRGTLYWAGCPGRLEVGGMLCLTGGRLRVNEERWEREMVLNKALRSDEILLFFDGLPRIYAACERDFLRQLLGKFPWRCHECL